MSEKNHISNLLLRSLKVLNKIHTLTPYSVGDWAEIGKGLQVTRYNEYCFVNSQDQVRNRGKPTSNTLRLRCQRALMAMPSPNG